jgi:hypothetical protein
MSVIQALLLQSAGYLGTFEGLSSVPFCSGAKCYYNIVSVRACTIDVLSCILKYI